jgi:hypothetical protein
LANTSSLFFPSRYFRSGTRRKEIWDFFPTSWGSFSYL